MVDLLNPQPTSGVQERIGEWQAYLQRPDVRAALITAGAAIAQPRPVGQSPFGHVASAVTQGAGAVQNLAEQDLAERKVEYAGNAQERQDRRADAADARDAANRWWREKTDARREQQYLTAQERAQRAEERQAQLDLERRQREDAKERREEARIQRDERRRQEQEYQKWTKAKSTAEGTDDNGRPIRPYDQLLLDPENRRAFERYWNGEYLNPPPAVRDEGPPPPKPAMTEQPAAAPQGPNFPNRRRLDPFAGQPLPGQTAAPAEAPAPGNVIDRTVASFATGAEAVAAKAAGTIKSGDWVLIGNVRKKVP